MALTAEHAPGPNTRPGRPISVIRPCVVLVMGVLSVPVFADQPTPTPDHVVVVVMENHSFSEIIDGRQAPFIADLARRGAMFTRSFAVTHPSQPNYFALFSGATHGITDNNAHALDAPTLASALHGVGKTFVGYVERGSPRKHNPWETFADAQHVEEEFAVFPSDFTKLPSISFVIPNDDNNMHDGSIEQGDAWLRQHLGAYAEWCASKRGKSPGDRFRLAVHGNG
jgi:phosphatidylinositol-3-phosphatase